jgi:hypothetical protein
VALNIPLRIMATQIREPFTMVPMQINFLFFFINLKLRAGL